MQTSDSIAGSPNFSEGDRVLLKRDFETHGAGAQGVIQSVGGGPDAHAEVLFDGGPSTWLPVSLLSLDLGDFRWVPADGTLSILSYRTEREAVEAAERNNFRAFRVVRVLDVASYRMENL